ncbi:hypothetical protein [Terasakiella sp.]|uniref:hypothetical protein n=1 Tax=Terasakiella sp. TaxID=2034861 RepID=UPI003B0019F0
MFFGTRVVLCVLALILMMSQGLASSLAGQTIRFCGDGSGWPPYTYTLPDNPDQIFGYDVDVVRAILAPHGIKSEFLCRHGSNVWNIARLEMSFMWR